MTTIDAIKAILLERERRKKNAIGLVEASNNSDNLSKPVIEVVEDDDVESKNTPRYVSPKNKTQKTSTTTVSKIHLDNSKSIKGKDSISKPKNTKKKTLTEKDSLFNESQKRRLIKEFNKNRSLRNEEIKSIATSIQMSDVLVKQWFFNKRKKKVRDRISKIDKSEKDAKIHKCKSIEVLALMSIEDINNKYDMKPSVVQSKTFVDEEVIDILDDSHESDKDLSLVEISNSNVMKTKDQKNDPELIEKNQPSAIKSSSLDVNKTSMTHEDGNVAVNLFLGKEKEKNLSKTCTRKQDIVEELLKKIEELEEELKEKEGDLYYTKKDYDSLQATLEGKERVLRTVQDSIPRVVSDHKKALETKDNEIYSLKSKVARNENDLDARNKEISELKKTIFTLDSEIRSKSQINKSDDHKTSKLEEMHEIEVSRLKNELMQRSSTEESNRLRESNASLQENLDGRISEIESLKLEKESLVKKHKEEINNLNEKLKSELLMKVDEIAKRDDEIKLLNYKLRVCSDYKDKYEDASLKLEESRKETLELRDYERKLKRRVENNELELYSKDAENQTQNLIIKKLNEKIQMLQKDQENIDVTVDKKFALNSIPLSSSYVVSSCKRKRSGDGSSLSNVSSKFSKVVDDDSDFDSLCSEVENLCESLISNNESSNIEISVANVEKDEVADFIIGVVLDKVNELSLM